MQNSVMLAFAVSNMEEKLLKYHYDFQSWTSHGSSRRITIALSEIWSQLLLIATPHHQDHHLVLPCTRNFLIISLTYFHSLFNLFLLLVIHVSAIWKHGDQKNFRDFSWILCFHCSLISLSSYHCLYLPSLSLLSLSLGFFCVLLC